MEFLDLQLDEMEVIQQTKPMYEFPAVTFSRYNGSFVGYFNRLAVRAFDGCQCFKIYANAEYVVFSPVQKKDHHSFKIHYAKEESASVSCMGLERCKLEGKAYKLYKTEKGFALKINDPLKKRKE